MMTEKDIREFVERLEGGPVIRKVEFPELKASSAMPQMQVSYEYIEDIVLTLTAELGRAVMKVRDILRLEPGSVIELNRLAGDTVELLVNEQEFGRGEVVVLGNAFGVRIDTIYSPRDKKVAKSGEH